MVKGAVLYYCATRGPRFAPRLCRNRPRPVRGATHNWPSVVRVREGLAGRDSLVSSHSSDSFGGLGAVRTKQGCEVHSVSSGTLGGRAAGLDAHCVKKNLVWLGSSIFIFG